MWSFHKKCKWLCKTKIGTELTALSHLSNCTDVFTFCSIVYLLRLYVVTSMMITRLTEKANILVIFDHVRQSFGWFVMMVKDDMLNSKDFVYLHIFNYFLHMRVIYSWIREQTVSLNVHSYFHFFSKLSICLYKH